VFINCDSWRSLEIDTSPYPNSDRSVGPGIASLHDLRAPKLPAARAAAASEPL
jgi:hypothetical protein